MTDKLFSVAGVTVHNGNAKVRFTDDLVRRVKQFTKGGATRCEFVELPEPMTKLDALNYMLTVRQFDNDEDQATINDAIEDRTIQSKRSEVKVSFGERFQRDAWRTTSWFENAQQAQPSPATWSNRSNTSAIRAAEGISEDRNSKA